MVLTPLAVILLAQLALVMLGTIFFQKLQKRRLIKEIESLKSPHRPFFSDDDPDHDEEGFDRPQAELLLNRIYQNTQTIISEAPAAKELCSDQQALLHSLAECIDVPLEPSEGQTTEKASSDIISQAQIDTALGKEEALEEFDMMDFDDLETSDDAFDEDLNLEIEEDGLPEDTLQAAIDRMGDLDLSDLEDELQKVEDD